MNAYLGIDTSCYTTSVAFVDESGKTLAAERRLLTVPEGGRGLRQQEMIFQHVAALPELMEITCARIPAGSIRAVGASTRPRAIERSYMPAFTAGEGFVRAVAAALHVSFYATDHQAGHIAAGRVSSGLSTDTHLALHLSGGTTELLCCDGEAVRKLGGTLDISAGQLVDRVGVALGLGFPAGPALEKIAVEALESGTVSTLNPGVSMRGCDGSISGAEAQIMREIGAGTDRGIIALGVYSFLSRLVARLIEAGVEQTGLGEVLLVGGVASSALFRKMMEERLVKKRNPVRTCFALPELSGDNAVGVALIARQKSISAGT